MLTASFSSIFAKIDASIMNHSTRERAHYV
jgi:hypothetical protein